MEKAEKGFFGRLGTRIKIIFFILLLIAIIIGGLFIWYYAYKLTHKQFIQVEGPLGKNMQGSSENDAEIKRLHEELERQRRNIESLTANLKEKENSLPENKDIIAESVVHNRPINQDYSQILFALVALENKIAINGGNVEKDIIKLQSFTSPIPILYEFSKQLTGIKSIISKDELNQEYGQYIREVKATHLLDKKTFFNKILAFFARYISFTNSSDAHDVLIIQMQKEINSNNFIEANKIANQINIKNEHTERFLENLDTLAKIEFVSNQLYFYIGERIFYNSDSSAGEKNSKEEEKPSKKKRRK
jgi:hypothetical protein